MNRPMRSRSWLGRRQVNRRHGGADFAARQARRNSCLGSTVSSTSHPVSRSGNAVLKGGQANSTSAGEWPFTEISWCVPDCPGLGY